MQNLLKIIENDDLEKFQQHFELTSWKESITTIPNYAGITKNTPEITYDNCDCLKYALHCNSDKIFNYLLPLTDTNKHGENYGWPLLAMALKNNRYDYANNIIEHPSFDPYPMYHTNCFMYIQSRSNIDEHIEFLFKYLTKFETWDFYNSRLLYNFVHLICYNADTFNRFNNFYKIKCNKLDGSILNTYQGNMEILGEEIFNRKYNPFIITQLSVVDIENILKAACKDNIFFVSLFKGDYAKEGLMHLIKCPEQLQQYFENNEILVSYLPLDCILLLMENGIDIWKENNNQANAIDYILDNNNLEDESTFYFINKYPQKIYDRLQKQNRKNNIQKYCHHKLLENTLTQKNSKNNNLKI